VSRAGLAVLAVLVLAGLAVPATAQPPQCYPYVYSWTYVSTPDGGTYRVPQDVRWRCG
jgi:hypothetical protein